VAQASAQVEHQPDCGTNHEDAHPNVARFDIRMGRKPCMEPSCYLASSYSRHNF
jgi:hypothetical protein